MKLCVIILTDIVVVLIFTRGRADLEAFQAGRRASQKPGKHTHHFSLSIDLFLDVRHRRHSPLIDRVISKYKAVLNLCPLCQFN